jgi:siroheme synthase
LADQQVLVSTLARIASESSAVNLAAPTMIVIGDIVDARRQLREAALASVDTAEPPFGKIECGS